MNRVNSQSKFHSEKAVEFSMRKRWNLLWEKAKKVPREDKKQEER